MAWDLCKPITCSTPSNSCYEAAPRPSGTFRAGGPPQPGGSSGSSCGCGRVHTTTSTSVAEGHYCGSHSFRHTHTHQYSGHGCSSPTHTHSPVTSSSCGGCCSPPGQVSHNSAASVKRHLTKDTYSNLKKSEDPKVVKYLKDWTSNHLMVDTAGTPRFVVANLQVPGMIVPEKWKDDKGFLNTIKVLDIYATNKEWGLSLTNDWFKKLKKVETIREMEAFGPGLERRLPRCDRLVTFVNPMGPKNNVERHSFGKIPLNSRLVVHARYPHTRNSFKWNKQAFFPKLHIDQSQIVNAREIVVIFTPHADGNYEISIASPADYDATREKPLDQIASWILHAHTHYMTGTQFTLVGAEEFLKAAGGVNSDFCAFKAQLERKLLSSDRAPDVGSERLCKLLAEEVEFVSVKDYEKRVGKPTYDLDMVFHPETWKSFPEGHPWAKDD